MWTARVGGKLLSSSSKSGLPGCRYKRKPHRRHPCPGWQHGHTPPQPLLDALTLSVEDRHEMS